jgi:hypothetical protein
LNIVANTGVSADMALEQGPAFLFGAVGGLGARHDAIALELGLDRIEGRLDLPALGQS